MSNLGLVELRGVRLYRDTFGNSFEKFQSFSVKEYDGYQKGDPI